MGNYNNILLFLFLSRGIFDPSTAEEEGVAFAFRVAHLGNMRDKLTSYFWLKAQRRLEIQCSGLIVSDDYVTYYFDLSD